MTASDPSPHISVDVAETIEQQLRLLPDYLPHIIWTARPDGWHQYYNQQWFTYTGLSLEQTQGWGWATVLHPDDLQSCLDQWHHAVHGRESYEVTHRYKRVDGVYRWHLGRAQPVRDAEGRLVLWVGTSTDIDDQIRDDVALRATEARHAATLDTVPDALITMDHLGRIIEFNPAAVQMFGYERDLVIGQNMADLLIPPDLRAQHRTGLAVYLATGQGPLIGQRVESTALRADGTPFPIELAITRVPLDGPPLFTGYVRDISARVKAEQDHAILLARVMERATQLDATFEAMTEAVAAFDTAGRITQANGAFQAMFGMDAVPHPPDPSGTLYTPLDENGHPLEPAEWPRFRILRGEVFTGLNALDTQARTRDGRTVQLNVSGAPFRDVEGHVSGGVMVLRDVTDRRQLEQRTRRALNGLLSMAQILVLGDTRSPLDPQEPRNTLPIAQRLVEVCRDVLGCSRVSILTLDTETKTFRPLAIIGVSAEDERAWRLRSNAEGFDNNNPSLVASLLAGEVVQIDMDSPPFRDRPNPYGIRVLLAVLLRVGSQPVGLLALDYGGEEHEYTAEERALTAAVAQFAAVVIERDVLLREREKAQANETVMREANRRMDEFLGVAGHEMRTPLTTIKGSLQLAQRRLQRVAEQQEASGIGNGLDTVAQLLNRSDMQLRRLERLVDDVLDVSRIHAGHLAIRRAPFDIINLAREIVDEQRHLATTHTIELHVVGESSVTVDADADRIGQVLSNYLTNALKYSSENQPVTVGVESRDDQVRVWVRDEGPGIAADKHAMIWERFYRVAGAEPRYGSSIGLGMGLHISRTIISQHGGQVGVESVPGQGSTFWFSLPREKST